MTDFRRPGAVVRILVIVLATSLPVAFAADDHADHDSGHVSGKGKGPKYAGGDRGAGHSDQAHKSGSHGHAGGAGGSKSLEEKIFRGDDGGHGASPEHMGGSDRGSASSDHEDGASHEH